MKPDNLFAEARAKILWGESSPSVRTFLVSNGVSEIGADAKISEFNAERHGEIRRIGIRRTFLGAALVIGAAISFCFAVTVVDLEKIGTPGYRGGRFLVMVVLGAGLLGCYGISKLIDGITYLVRPQSKENSIFETSE